MSFMPRWIASPSAAISTPRMEIMTTRIARSQMHITKEPTSIDPILKMVTALLITIAAAIMLFRIESYFIGDHAVDLLTAEHHIAEFFPQ
jgi:hypothetical protein